MKKYLIFIFATLCTLVFSPVQAQLIQSSSLITTIEKLSPTKRGYQSNISVSYAIVNPKSRSFDLTVAYIGGFRFNNTFFLGAGAEIEYADFTRSHVLENESGYYLPRNKVSLPLLAHFRIYFLKNRISPFFALSGGYIIGLPNNKKFEYNDGKRVRYTCGTPFAEPILGVNSRISHKTSLFISFGYRLFGLPCTENVRWSDNAGFESFDIKQKISGSLRINIGVTF